MVPDMAPRVCLISDLDDAIAALQSADDLFDNDAGWTHVQNVLTCMYRFDASEKNHADRAAYYRRRDDSPGGRIAGALIWVRGLVVYHAAEFRMSLFTPFALSDDDRSLQPLTIRRMPGGQMVMIEEVVWPQRRYLPPPGRRYKSHQRDAHYDALVAGQPLLGPLRAARDYFADER